MTEIHDHTPHDHTHHHDHDRHHGHHEHGHLLWATFAAVLHLPGYAHTHEHTQLAHDLAAHENELGIRTVKLALLALGITTVLQVLIYVASGSVALLADTVHNLGDALNSIPLWIAFVLAKRAANRRYTYGYGRAEDVAGLFIVLSIGFSAAYILWESFQKLLHPQPLDNLGWVAVAALIGFVGNEIVAIMQIRVGRQINSEAMVADGLHARTDGFTSLAVLLAAVGAALGFPILDPIIGFVIGVAILFITRDAAVAVWFRLMDAVDPELIGKAEQIVREHPEIKHLHRLQMRWLGHRLYAEIVLALEGTITTADHDAITDHIRHHLYHAIPGLSVATIAVIPAGAQGQTFWRESAHHQL